MINRVYKHTMQVDKLIRFYRNNFDTSKGRYLNVSALCIDSDLRLEVRLEVRLD